MAQQLRVSNPTRLYCWQQSRAEVEFVTTQADCLVPIEVKAGHVTRAKSLEKYQGLYTPQHAYILSGNKPMLNKKEVVQYIPIYAAEWLAQ